VSPYRRQPKLRRLMNLCRVAFKGGINAVPKVPMIPSAVHLLYYVFPNSAERVFGRYPKNLWHLPMPSMITTPREV
jgi:hypothetical protein